MKMASALLCCGGVTWLVEGLIENEANAKRGEPKREDEQEEESE